MRWSLVFANEKLIIFLTVAMGGGRRSEIESQDAVDHHHDADADTDAYNVVYYDRDYVEANDGASQDYGDNDPTSGTTSRGGVAHASKRDGGGGGKDAMVWWDISQSQASQMSQYSAGEEYPPHDHDASNAARSTKRQLPSSSTTKTPRFLTRDERRKRSRMAQEQQQRRYEHSDSSSDDDNDDDSVGDGEKDGDDKVEEGSEDPFATIMGSQSNGDSGDEDEEEGGEEEEEMDNNDSQHDKTPPDQQMAEQDNAADNDYDDDADDFPIPDQSPDDGHDEYGNQHNSMYASRGDHHSPKSSAGNYAGGLHYDDNDRSYAYGVDDGGCGGIDMNALRRQSMKRSIGSTKSTRSSKHSTRQSMTTSMAASRGISSKKRNRSSFADFGGGRGMTMHDDDDLMSDLTNAAGGNTDMLVAARKAVATSSGRSSISSAKESRSKKTSARRNDDSNATGVKKAKSSIVGSRPMHWGGRLGRKSSSSMSKQRQTESSDSAKVAKKKLSDATRRSTMDRLASASRRKSRAKGAAPKTPASALSRAAASASGTGGTAAHTPKSKGSKSADTPGTAASSSSKWERHVNLREMEFAPAFISSRPSDANTGAAMGLSIQDDVALTPTPNGHQSHPQGSQGVTPVRFNLDGTNTGDGSMDAAMTSSISATPCLSGKRSRKRAKAMGLTKLLRDIRSASDGDCMRLKSGASQAPHLARRRRMTDVSDPRNRAAYRIDVTLLGDPIPWEGGIKRTTILGYVHSTHIQKADDVIGLMLPKAEAFAWVILDYDTINEKRVGRGTQLRIYDPMLIPSPEDLPSTIACTKVCELYPTDLPPLSPVPKFDGAIIEG